MCAQDPYLHHHLGVRCYRLFPPLSPSQRRQRTQKKVIRKGRRERKDTEEKWFRMRQRKRDVTSSRPPFVIQPSLSLSLSTFCLFFSSCFFFLLLYFKFIFLLRVLQEDSHAGCTVQKTGWPSSPVMLCFVTRRCELAHRHSTRYTHKLVDWPLIRLRSRREYFHISNFYFHFGEM